MGFKMLNRVHGSCFYLAGFTNTYLEDLGMKVNSNPKNVAHIKQDAVDVKDNISLQVY